MLRDLCTWIGIVLSCAGCTAAPEEPSLPAAAPAAAPVAANWPGFAGPGMTGISPEAIADTWPADGPTTLWQRELSSGWGGCAVYGSEVYLLDNPGQESEMLLCLDLQTGRELWRDEWPNDRKDRWEGSRTVPTVDAERVYVAGHNGECRVYDRGSRTLLWKVNLQRRFFNRPPLPYRRQRGPNWGYSGNPLLAGNAVIFSPQSMDAGLAAFDQRSGKLLWTSPFSGLNTYSNQQPALVRLNGVDQIVVMGNQYIGKDPPALISGFDAASGRLLWQTLTPGRCNVPIPPVVQTGPDTLYTSQGYTLGAIALQIVPSEKADPALDPAVAGMKAVTRHDGFVAKPAKGLPFTAQLLYRQGEPQCHMQKPILYKGSIWANSFDGFHSRRNIGLCCVDPQTGRVRWSTGPERTFENGPLLIADDKLLILDGRTGVLTMAAADPDGFQPLAEAKIFDERLGDIWAPMALSQGRLLLRSKTLLKCLDLRRPGSAAAQGTDAPG